MLIIPVLDLSRGLVVHAKKGMRKCYRAILSEIATDPEPPNVIAAFLELYPFKIIYIADLDAIQGHVAQHHLINEIALQFKQCEFWLDAGLETIENGQSQYTANNIQFILGSETELPPERLSALIKPEPSILLSLDFNHNGLIANNYLLHDTSFWPQQLIVMMLHRVGSAEGVDFQCLQNILRRGKQHDIYAAGGIQNINDLKRLKAMGVKGSLLATTLHNGTISKRELDQIHHE